MAGGRSGGARPGAGACRPAGNPWVPLEAADRPRRSRAGFPVPWPADEAPYGRQPPPLLRAGASRLGLDEAVAEAAEVHVRAPMPPTDLLLPELDAARARAAELEAEVGRLRTRVRQLRRRVRRLRGATPNQPGRLRRWARRLRGPRDDDRARTRQTFVSEKCVRQPYAGCGIVADSDPEAELPSWPRRRASSSPCATRSPRGNQTPACRPRRRGPCARPATS